jgi:hypothetical protein
MEYGRLMPTLGLASILIYTLSAIWFRSFKGFRWSRKKVTGPSFPDILRARGRSRIRMIGPFERRRTKGG